MNKLYILLISLVVSNISFAKDYSDKWTDHFSYRGCQFVGETENFVAVANDVAIVIWDKKNDEYTKFSKANGLSDIGISALTGLSDDQFIIGYKNGNIDIIKDGKVSNLPEIMNKGDFGSKAINHFYVHDNLIYLSLNFGIQVLDFSKQEFKDTFYPTENNTIVYELCIIGNQIFASTKEGLLVSTLDNPQISIESGWNLISGNMDEVISITEFKDKLLAAYVFNENATDSVAISQFNQSENDWAPIDTVIRLKKMVSSGSELYVLTNNSVLGFNEQWELVINESQYNIDGNKFNITPKNLAFSQTEEQVFYLADYNYGFGMLSSIDDFIYWPSGPYSNTCFKLMGTANGIYSIEGGRDNTYNNLHKNFGFSYYDRANWNFNFSRGGDGTWKDAVDICIDKKEPDNIYIGAWNPGAFLINETSIVTNYDETNSGLQGDKNYNTIVRIGGLDSDRDGNIWFCNSGAANGIVVKSPADDWYQFNYQVLSYIHSATELLVANGGLVFVVLSRMDKVGKEGLVVINTNATPYDQSDDHYRSRVSPASDNDQRNAGYLELWNESGDIHSNHITVLAEDKNGHIWVGTDKGLVVYYQPNKIFTEEKPLAKRIMIPREGQLSDDGKQIVDPLLENETITSICVDGANRKWIGTESSGAYLVSEDGLKTYLHFDEANSPLPSNTVNTIAVDPVTGEVFFGTPFGISSYKGDATEGVDEISEIHAFPNPVRESYNGPITITGLSINSNVKITTVSGKLVHESKSLGGIAQWDGRNLWGERVKSGVYIVYAVSEDGSRYQTTKILIVR